MNSMSSADPSRRDQDTGGARPQRRYGHSLTAHLDQLGFLGPATSAAHGDLARGRRHCPRLRRRAGSGAQSDEQPAPRFGRRAGPPASLRPACGSASAPTPATRPTGRTCSRRCAWRPFCHASAAADHGVAVRGGGVPRDDRGQCRHPGFRSARAGWSRATRPTSFSSTWPHQLCAAAQSPAAGGVRRKRRGIRECDGRRPLRPARRPHADHRRGALTPAGAGGCRRLDRANEPARRQAEAMADLVGRFCLSHARLPFQKAGNGL